MRELYSERVAKIREVMPHACIGVDVIVGFRAKPMSISLKRITF